MIKMYTLIANFMGEEDDISGVFGRLPFESFTKFPLNSLEVLICSDTNPERKGVTDEK